MKPRSSIERKFVDLANTLPPIDPAVLEWAKSVFPDEALFWQHRGNSREVWCQSCGHMEPCDSRLVMSAKGYDCPVCGRHMDVKDHKTSRNVTSILVTVFDVVEGEQVMRVFEVTRANYRGRQTEYYASEVYQIWIRENGREIITTRGYNRGFNFFYWRYSDGYQIGTHRSYCSVYYYYEDVYSPEENYIYPKMKFSDAVKTLRINGKRRKAMVSLLMKKKVDLSRSLAYLLKNRNIESLFSAGYEKLYWFMLDGRRDFSRYRHAVNICHRNRYVISSPDMWLDYIDNLIELGLDTHNAHYVCPDNLLLMHGQMARRVQRKREKEDMERKLEQARKDEQKFREEKSQFFPLVFNDKDFSVVCIQSVEEVAVEGKVLHHCVFTNRYYAKKDSLLLSARDHDGSPIETAEIDLRTMKILQCRGKFNHNSPLHGRIIRTINANMWQIENIARRAL